jgi:hypothetical protein
MAPEQCLSEAIDARSDVYATGALFYELVTGEPPFRSSDPQRVMRQHLLAPPPRPSLRCAGIDARVDAIVLRALAKNPAERFPTMLAFRRALLELIPASLATGALVQESGTYPAMSSSMAESFSHEAQSSPTRVKRDAVAEFLAVREFDSEKRFLSALLRDGDVPAIAARVMRLRARKGDGATRALALLDDANNLAPMAESLLANDIDASPHVETLLQQIGLPGARALWAARIRRPPTPERRTRFVIWLIRLGPASQDLVLMGLRQLGQGAPSEGQADCAEDLLLAVGPRPDPRLCVEIEPWKHSPFARVRQQAAALLTPREALVRRRA